MYFDSGRRADMDNLARKIRESTSEVERNKYRQIEGEIKRQAEHPTLNMEREKLLNARRQGDRKAADNLETRLDKEIRP